MCIYNIYIVKLYRVSPKVAILIDLSNSQNAQDLENRAFLCVFFLR